MKRILKWVIGGLLVFGCGASLLFMFLPVPEDPIIPAAEQGGGARQSNNATTGLQASWPQVAEVNMAQAELGRLLFYDPVLSANDDMSCASCHHPDLGFSDGLQVAEGAHGEDLRRNTPTLWNVAYGDSFFWDGRAASLEEQMLEPLTASDEMASDLDAVVAELKDIPEYVDLFDAAYDDGITINNVTTSIAEFERTLLSQNSPFDRFAAGDFNALTPPQRRGFDIFRSAVTRCFECHAWPTFTDNTFHVLGVPDTDPDNPDMGQSEIINAPDAERGFRIPSLRNVAVSGPYMHNGTFETLEEVVEFYEKGGGEAFGVTDVVIDEKVRGFELTDQERADLIAFMVALTDEPSELIAIPESVPSGLPVVESIENPARDMVEVSTAPPYDPGEPRDPQTIRVRAGESIQAAVDSALPGDTIEVEPGVYYETVYIDMDRITMIGIVDGDERAWLDGENDRSDGFNATGDDFTVEGFGFRGYIGNDILVTGAERVRIRDVIVQGVRGVEGKSTIYGIYPIECTDVIIENSVVSGVADAGIYVGQSRGPIIVRHNEVFDNVTGIEIENSTNADVHNNDVHDNTGGILVFLLPNNPSKVGYNTRVFDNEIYDNNLENYGDPDSTVGIVPAGTGILIMTADNTEVFNNNIRNHRSMGLGLTSLYQIYDEDTVFDLGPLPENNWIHDNNWENNGYDADGLVKDLGLEDIGVKGGGADIIWSGEGWNNAFDEPNASAFPPLLPGRDWPDPLKRGIWRTYDILIGLLM